MLHRINEKGKTQTQLTKWENSMLLQRITRLPFFLSMNPMRLVLAYTIYSESLMLYFRWAPFCDDDLRTLFH